MTGEKQMITFKYTGTQTKQITNLFKNTNLEVTYKINNMNKKLLKTSNISCKNQHNDSGLHQLTCPDSHKVHNANQ